MTELNVGIILGSTRPGRNGEQVAKWVLEHAQRDGVRFELVDLADFPLPHLDEPVPPSFGQYSQEHTKTWAAKVAEFDAYVFVTPEYNHSVSGVLKNALDFVYAEWNNKAAGIVSYGSASGVRAAEQLRLILGELQIADVRGQVMFNLATDFEEYKTLTPGPQHEEQLSGMLDQLSAWGSALKTVRAAG